MLVKNERAVMNTLRRGADMRKVSRSVPIVAGLGVLALALMLGLAASHDAQAAINTNIHVAIDMVRTGNTATAVGAIDNSGSVTFTTTAPLQTGGPGASISSTTAPSTLTDSSKTWTV